MVTYEKCPECKKNTLRWRDSFKSYRCDRCFCEFDNNKQLLEEPNMIIDKFGNRYVIEIKKEGCKIIQTKTYFMGDKITLKGQYPKLKNDEECAYSERQDCNSGIGYRRCPYMKYEEGRWICKFLPKSEKIYLKHKG